MAFGDDTLDPSYKPQRDPLLQERKKTHGDFRLNAAYSQALKHIFYSPIAVGTDCVSPGPLPQVARESLDMIALKISRILSGQWDFKDHWDDIAGYAKLAAEQCPK